MRTGTWNCGGGLLGQGGRGSRLKKGSGAVPRQQGSHTRPQGSPGSIRNTHLLPLGDILQKSDADSVTFTTKRGGEKFH